jgi:hypothetical protein
LHVKNVITKLKHEQDNWKGAYKFFESSLLSRKKVRHKHRTFTGYPNASFKGQAGRLENKFSTVLYTGVGQKTGI